MRHAEPLPKIERASERSQEPRWPVIIAILICGMVYASLPGYLLVGPRWLLFSLLLLLEIPATIALHTGRHHASKWIGYVISVVLTVFVIASLAFLILALMNHREKPIDLLGCAIALWISNVFNFSLWYWRLDAGGPIARDRVPGHTEGAFLFPQMTLPHARNQWSPRYVDYLFLAFNTSTAFSPTDVPVLGRWAKVLVMLQSAISLTIIAILVGRAINIM